jgi:hypothetical protein
MKSAVLKVQQAIDSGNGSIFSRFFDINHLTSHRETCDRLLQEDVPGHLTRSVWAESFEFLLRVPLQPTPSDSFQTYNQAAAPIIRDFSSLEPSLCVPCIRCLARSFRHFASRHPDMYPESVSQMQKLIRLAARAGRQEGALLSVVNALMAVYFLRNNFKRAEQLLASVGPQARAGQNSRMGELVAWRFNQGKTLAIKGDIQGAADSLSWAWEKCPIERMEHRRLILVYFIPVQLCCGTLPTTSLLHEYRLSLFTGFVDAIIQGDIEKYDGELARNCLLLTRLGLYQLMARLRLVVFYQVLKIVHTAYGDVKMPISAFRDALHLYWPFTLVETEPILIMLIRKKFVKAYVHMGSSVGPVAVFRPTDAFPSITSESWTI